MKTKKNLLVKIFALFCLAAILFSLVPLVALAENPYPDASGQKQLFVITAYYSPLPGQTRYLTGNLESEKRLNGRGTNGADGTPVYTGMLAAPSSYSFGTKIYIPGLGVGTVHDRGGAIRVHDNYHRIDVWMGSGDEGLARALQWGKRYVEGYIYDNPNEVAESLSFTHISADLPPAYKYVPMFTRNLSLGHKGDEVRKLQKSLQELGYFQLNPTGSYGSLTQSAVFDFQKANSIVTTMNDYGAGVFGPQTRKTLERVIQTGEKVDPVIQKTTPDPVPEPKNENAVLKTTVLTPGLGKNATGVEVKRLQLVLRSLGYYTGELTEVYDPKTIDAVYSFQIDNGVIQSEHDRGAGYYGKLTHVKLQEVLQERKIRRESFEEKEYSEFVMESEMKHAKEIDTIKGTYQPALSEREAKLYAVERIGAGESGDHVRVLQEKLISQGYLNEGLNTGYYGELTREAIMNFQKAHELISDHESPGAGDFGPKTKAALFIGI